MIAEELNKITWTDCEKCEMPHDSELQSCPHCGIDVAKEIAAIIEKWYGKVNAYYCAEQIRQSFQCALPPVVVSKAELPPDTICVLCEGICEPSPTEKGWTHLRYQQGAHHDCLITMGKKTEHMIKQGGN